MEWNEKEEFKGLLVLVEFDPGVSRLGGEMIISHNTTDGRHLWHRNNYSAEIGEKQRELKME